jgi:alpha-1,2-mannosyltransferase
MTAPPRSRQILFVVFFFFYLPVLYYWGWVLTKAPEIDFPSFYFAAQAVFIDGISPYGPSAFKIPSLALGWRVNPFLYPPPSLIALWPLAELDILPAQTAFLVVSHLCFLGSLWLILTKLTRFTADLCGREVILGISLVYALSFDPVLKTLGLGQVNLIVLFFLCLTLTALKDGASAWRLALPLSIAILLKTYPVLLFVPLFFRKRFGAIGLTCAFFAIFAGIAAFVVPEAAWRDWFFHVMPTGGYADNAISAGFGWNQSMNGWVTRLLVTSRFGPAPLPYPGLAKPLAIGLATLVVGVTAALSYRLSKREDYREHGDDEIAAYLLMIFLIAPLSWDHHLVYILPAATLAIGLIASGSTGRGTTAVLVAALFLMAWNIPLDHPDLKTGWWTLLISIKFYSAAALWILFVTRMHRAARSAVPKSSFP